MLTAQVLPQNGAGRKYPYTLQLQLLQAAVSTQHLERETFVPMFTSCKLIYIISQHNVEVCVAVLRSELNSHTFMST